MSTLQKLWARLFEEERDAWVLGLLRLALSVLLLIHTGRLSAQLWSDGYFADFFHLPLLPESWVPSQASYACLLFVQALACVLAFAGWFPREALLLASCAGLYELACDRLQYHNNRYALMLLAFLVAFTPCDRSLVLIRGRAHTLPLPARVLPTFARRLFQIQVSLVYIGSAVGKLLDADWRGGQVLLLRFAKSADVLAQHGFPLPSSFAAVLASATFASLAAKAAIGSELFIALGCWLPRTRRLALWVGVLFHIGIELSARVELFSWLMVCSYLAFVTPELRERRIEFDSSQRAGRLLARVVMRLDWCARFERIARPEGLADGRAFRVTDRAGRCASGLSGSAELASAIPVLFPLWLPLLAISRVRQALTARLGFSRA